MCPCHTMKLPFDIFINVKVPTCIGAYPAIEDINTIEPPLEQK